MSQKHQGIQPPLPRKGGAAGEALTISFPYFFESIIAKFVNASTIDGYNPYVVNKADGIAWECPEAGPSL